MSLPREGHKARTKILQDIKDIPHSFRLLLDDLGTRLSENGNSSLRSQEKHLRAAMKAGYETPWETARTKNLLAFVLFKLDSRDDALLQLNDILQNVAGQHSNLVSLANKAHILSQGTDLDDAKAVVKQLRDLRVNDPTYPYLEVKAKAELASSYMRFGPAFSQKAVSGLREVLPLARGDERWTWQFTLAVALRQTLSLQYAPYAAQTDRGEYTQNINKEALVFLEEVLVSPEASDSLKANVHAELALLLRSVWDKQTQDQLAAQAETGPLAECKKALKLAPEDPTVLWKTGKVFRHYRDVFRSKKLLEKSLELQESSAAYHHLGLTYKAMATNAQHGTLHTRRAGKRQQQRRAARQRWTQQGQQQHVSTPGPQSRTSLSRQGAAALEFEVRPRTAEGNRQPMIQRGAPRPGSDSWGPSQPTPGSERGPAQQKASDTVDRIRKVVKAPSNKVTQLSPKDENVKMAIKYLNEAIEFSCDENTRAIYDLGLLYKATNNIDIAITMFKKICDKGSWAGPLEQITALEQLGLAYREKSEGGPDEQNFLKKSEQMLFRALTRSADLYSNTRHMASHFVRIFQSPAALLKAAEGSEYSERNRKLRKADIFSLIADHKTSLRLLEEIKQEGPEDHAKLISICVAAGKLEKAVASLALIKKTGIYQEVIEKLGESEVRDIYLKAGEEALQEGTGNMQFVSLFQFAFRKDEPGHTKKETTADNDLETGDNGSGGSSDDSGEADGGGSGSDSEKAAVSPADDRTPPSLDVLVLQDEESQHSVQREAEALARVLEHRCELRVAINDDNYQPGVDKLHSIPNNIDTSRVVVVVPGRDPSKMFETFLQQAAGRTSTVVLLPKDVPLPRRLVACPSRDFPANLLALDHNASGPLLPEQCQLVADVVKFFLPSVTY